MSDLQPEIARQRAHTRGEANRGNSSWLEMVGFTDPTPNAVDRTGALIEEALAILRRGRIDMLII